MKAVVTVTGKDTVGIIAKISTKCAEFSANIIDITQSVVSGYFAMVMVADIDSLEVQFAEFADALKVLGEENGLVIHAIHEDVFNAMHHI